jgi:uncharacterized protein YxjI
VPSDEKVKRQIAKSGAQGAAWAGDGTLLGEPVLVVNQKTKLIELTNEYKVLDQEGQEIGAVRQVGQSTAKKALRLVGSFDQFMTHTYEIADADGDVLLKLTRPRKAFKSRFLVAGPQDVEIGQVVQENVFGKIRFALEARGERVGSLNAQNWRAWNFSIRDGTDQEVARITKTFEGVARTVFTTADHYVVHIHRPLHEPLRSLALASALCVDTALKQDSRGLT